MKLINKCKERGSGVLLCLGILGLLMSISLTFIFSSRSHAELANAQSGTVKAGLLVESGLERALAGMQQTWQPASSLPWYNFTQDDLNILGQKISGEVFPDDLKDASSLKVRFIYHGGKIDPNWFGSSEVVPKGGSIGFSPLGHSIGSESLYVLRDDYLTPVINEDNNKLWYSREQVQYELDPKLAESSFSNNGVENDYFFPFSPRDSSSPLFGEDTTSVQKDAPYLVIRNDGRVCDTSTPYGAKFHESFCKKYSVDKDGVCRCVYFGGGNTFLDEELAKYENGKLINPEIAIKRRVPFYCLRYLEGGPWGRKQQINGVWTVHIDDRKPSRVEFIDENDGGNWAEVPEYLRGQRLIDCVPWFRKIHALENYGNSGTDESSLWRFWQLLSNFTRYSGPSNLAKHNEAVNVYDSNVVGRPYCGRRSGLLPSKVRLKLKQTKSPSAPGENPEYKIVMQIETVNFYTQSRQEGNRTTTFLHNPDTDHIVKFDENGEDKRTNFSGNVTFETAAGTINNTPVLTSNSVILTDSVNIKRVVFTFKVTNTARFGSWGPTVKLDFDTPIKLTYDEDKGDVWEYTLECKDPNNCSVFDAWEIYAGEGESGWGNPNLNWDRANGAYAEGKVPNPIGGSALTHLPATSYIRGTFPEDDLSAYGGGVENQPTYVRNLSEIGVINRALPGRTIDIIDIDRELLDQFCLLVGDDEDSFELSKSVYSKNNNSHMIRFLTESGKFNPNSINNAGALQLVVNNLLRSEATASAAEVYGNPESAKVKGGITIPNTTNTFKTRGDAAKYIAGCMQNATIREKEEVAGKMAQLMQVRYQYFEIVVKAEVAKKISDVDVRGANNKKVEGISILSAVVERDAFTGAVRVLAKRDRFYELRR